MIDGDDCGRATSSTGTASWVRTEVRVGARSRLEDPGRDCVALRVLNSFRAFEETLLDVLSRIFWL